MTLEGYIGQLQAALKKLEESTQRLERERGYLLETMNQIQSNFGDQAAGTQMVIELYRAINHAAMADSALYAASSALRSYISQITSQ